ncbi:MAG: TetR/AcrR family transcriptional regulator [Proteobacteria bacterium]|nr:TetR/AcrR family transcriptional regulator [Pseudomonadota bacterium]
MNTKSGTKEKILIAAATLIYHKGFNHTGIQEILNNAGVPKGSFYFHFTSKEDLGIQLIDYYGELFLPTFLEYLNGKEGTPVKRMRQMFNAFSMQFANNRFAGGCPIGNLSQEMGDLSENFREKLKASILGLRQLFAAFLEQAKDKSELPKNIDIAETADFIFSSWEGAILQMKVMKSTQPLQIFEKMVFEKLLKS